MDEKIEAIIVYRKILFTGRYICTSCLTVIVASKSFTISIHLRVVHTIILDIKCLHKIK